MNGADQIARASLLVVEDSRIQAKILTDKLLEAGYDVRAAENGQLGLGMIRQKRPTLVISDIEMPEMAGYELCNAVKSDPELRTIPFILLSTLSDAQDIIKDFTSRWPTASSIQKHLSFVTPLPAMIPWCTYHVMARRRCWKQTAWPSVSWTTWNSTSTPYSSLRAIAFTSIRTESPRQWTPT